MRIISLTQGKQAVVDDKNYDRLACYKWYAARYKHLWYAQREVRLENGSRTTVKMHRLIFPDSIKVDLIDGDGLNNQEHNLRRATDLQNGANRRKCLSPKTSSFKGVHFRKDTGQWRATIRVNWKLKNIGQFPSEELAARAYDTAAIEHFGEFACLNFKSPQ